MKRGRNQRRRQGGVNPNRALDSNGPDVRIRGTANQIYDKYQNLARDAASAGDRVKAENYLQHAEHYFRMIRSIQATQQPQNAPQQSAGEGDQPAVENDGDQRSSRSRQKPRRNGAADSDSAQDENTKSEASENDSDSGDENAEDKKPKRRRVKRTTKAAKPDSDEAAKETAPAE